MAGATIIRKVTNEIGKDLAKLMAKKAPSRVLGHLARDSRVWKKAFEHIAEHFEPIAGKPAHAVFEPKYRSMTAMQELITKAMTKLGRAPVVTKLTDAAGVPVGKPAVILEKEFAEVIGRKGATECRILRVVVDFTGRLITAYPVEKFVSGAAVAGAISSTASAGASELPDVVKQIYAEEAGAAQKRIDRACGNSVLAYVVDFLVDPTCTGLDPQELISDAGLEKRIFAAIARIESQLGLILDDETRQNIREDIGRLWGRR
jgi:hypothetical protein